MGRSTKLALEKLILIYIDERQKLKRNLMIVDDQLDAGEDFPAPKERVFK
jgi:hypothetical protein